MLLEQEGIVDPGKNGAWLGTSHNKIYKTIDSACNEIVNSKSYTLKQTLTKILNPKHLAAPARKPNTYKTFQQTVGSAWLPEKP